MPKCNFCYLFAWLCDMAIWSVTFCSSASQTAYWYWEVISHYRPSEWRLKAPFGNPHSVDQTWKEKSNQWKRGKQAVGVKCRCAWHCVRPGLMTRLLCLLSYSPLFPSSFLLPPLPLLLCFFLLSKGFLMTNLSGLASLPISHCGIQLPAHPLMNSPDSKDGADRGEDRWKIQKHTTPPSFTFQDSTPPVSSQASSFSLFSPPFNILCHSQLPMDNLINHCMALMNWPAGVYWSLGYQRLAFVKSNTLFWAQRSNKLRKSGNITLKPFFFLERRSAQKTLAEVTSANMCIRQKANPHLHPPHAPLLLDSCLSLCYTCHIYRNNISFIKGISVIFQVVLNQKRSLQLIKVSSVHHH